MGILTNATFWSALSAIATAVMAVLTYCTITQSKKQLKEMKRQWDEDIRPVIEISPVVPSFAKRDDSLSIEIKNIGRGVASNVKLNIEQSFIEAFPIEEVRNRLVEINNSTFQILPNDTKSLNICFIKHPSKDEYRLNGKKLKLAVYKNLVEYLSYFSFKVSCSYNGYRSEHIVSSNDLNREKFNYLAFLEDIDSELGNINNNLDFINSTLTEISDKK